LISLKNEKKEKRYAIDQIRQNLDNELKKRQNRFYEALKDSEMNSFLLENESDDDLNVKSNLKLSKNLPKVNHRQEIQSIKNIIKKIKSKKIISKKKI
jgi:hypothetical protein